VAKVYSRFKPDTGEGDRWERIAAARDAEKWAHGGATVVPASRTMARKYMKKPPQGVTLAMVIRIAGAGLEPATPAV
jgi:hypothetical protein